MLEVSDKFNQKVAFLVGRSVNGALSFIIEQGQDFTLLLLERTAARGQDNPATKEKVRQLMKGVSVVMGASFFIPSIAERIARGMTYSGLTVSFELLRRIKKTLAV
ncbi:MAG: hypothetical protein IH948_00515 [Bacteroidetes bacterium]|nr:hypothetical protein [Bacteroidota bacterium]